MKAVLFKLVNSGPLMVSVNAEELLWIKFGVPGLPPYTTVIEWLPTAKLEVLKVALPPESVAVPKVVEPSRKLTVPDGVPLPGALALTVAVKVTV